MSDQQDQQEGYIQELFPVVFVAKLCSPILLGGMIIPFFFIILKLSKLHVLPIYMADAIIPVFSNIWPVIIGNYQAIKRVGGDTDATNYATFCAVILMYAVFITIYCIIKYFQARFSIKRPDVVLDGGAAGMGILMYMTFSKSEVVRFNSYSVFDFSFNRFGTHYMQQYFVLVVVVFLISVLVVSVLRLSDGFIAALRKTNQR